MKLIKVHTLAGETVWFNPNYFTAAAINDVDNIQKPPTIFIGGLSLFVIKDDFLRVIKELNEEFPKEEEPKDEGNRESFQ